MHRIRRDAAGSQQFGHRPLEGKWVEFALAGDPYAGSACRRRIVL
jgi:hypothetical protein